MRFKVQVFPIRDAFSINQEDVNQGEDRDSLNFLIIPYRKFREMKLIQEGGIGGLLETEKPHTQKNHPKGLHSLAVT